jgi:hypothetical protein
MLEAANPLRVGWVEVEHDDADALLAAVFGGQGLFQAAEAPVCGALNRVEACCTTDGIARRFCCDKPAGHDGKHRHIYTGDAELARDGNGLEQAWWTTLVWEAS